MIADPAVIQDEFLSWTDESEFLPEWMAECTPSWLNEDVNDNEYSIPLLDLDFSSTKENFNSQKANLEVSDEAAFISRQTSQITDYASENLYSDLKKNMQENVFTSNTSNCTTKEPLHWSCTELEVNKCLHRTSTTPKKPAELSLSARKSKCSRSHSALLKPWSELSREEQVEVVDELTEVASQEMGLREQLNVIRIINDQATISATDTEFIIDLEKLNDEKLERIRKYMKEEKGSLSSCSNLSSDSESLSEGTSTILKSTKQKRRKQELLERKKKKVPTATLR